MNKLILKNIIVLFSILLTILSFVGCDIVTNKKEASSGVNQGVSISPFEPVNFEKNGTVFSFAAISDSTIEAGRIGDNLVIENLNEPINIEFGQTGKNRNVIMHVYYDYLPIDFRVGETENFNNSFKFKIEDQSKLEFPIYLDPNIVIDDQSHKIMFIFTPSYDEYAKDKTHLTHNSSTCNLYQLHFGQYCEKPNLPSSKYPISVAEKYFDYSSTKLMLNTDISNLNTKEFNGLKDPEKQYIVSANEEFNLNYIITNLSEPAKTALIFLTVGHQVTDVNNQNYLWVDLNNSSMSVGKLTFTTPNEPGLYDVIGYVVFEPFELFSNPAATFPDTSIRFTIEVQ